MAGVVVCIGQSQSGPMVLSYLEGKIPIKAVIRESKVSSKTFLKRRVKKLGYWKVFGQLLFMVYSSRILASSARKRIEGLISDNRLYTTTDRLNIPLTDLDSINSEEARTLLKEHDPDVVLVIGTRIIGKKTLGAIKARWINVHAGITPLFRGVHGGYWARATGKKMGTTIHYIDEGIDTGMVIFQKEVAYQPKDNFVVYPYLQMIGILPDLEKVINALLAGDEPAMQPMYEESKLWSHPTIFQYIANRIAKGAR